jgi:hypothetical protein
VDTGTTFAFPPTQRFMMPRWLLLKVCDSLQKSSRREMENDIDRVAIEWSGRKSPVGPTNTWRKMGHLGDDWLGITILVAGFEHTLAFLEARTQQEANCALAKALRELAQKVESRSIDEAPCADCGEVSWLYDRAGVMLCADCYEAREYEGFDFNDDTGSSC